MLEIDGRALKRTEGQLQHALAAQHQDQPEIDHDRRRDQGQNEDGDAAQRHFAGTSFQTLPVSPTGMPWAVVIR